eukprot:TRINITY_DN45566_c0_g1_i1.p2 TRINITY_DN45566_c0_g1~~TRINITY_DN45566_c0_g1_i1.p2  ORF type:complete len:121 (-),score=2.85 TRINITY_DN45566_c0_g1_i1:190-552(-)
MLGPGSVASWAAFDLPNPLPVPWAPLPSRGGEGGAAAFAVRGMAISRSRLSSSSSAAHPWARRLTAKVYCLAGHGRYPCMCMIIGLEVMVLKHQSRVVCSIDLRGFDSFSTCCKVCRQAK